jgi:protein ImuB
VLWLCSYFPSLPSEALAPPTDRPTAVIDRVGNRKRVHWANALAREQGVQCGMNLPAAQALAPNLLVQARDPAAEKQAMQARASWAYQFGSPVALAVDRHVVWVEVGASISMHGGWEALSGHIAKAAAETGYNVQLGVAPTLGSSELVARWMPNLTEPIFALQDIRKRIATLPARALPLADDAVALLEGSGLSTIRDVLKVPSSALALRIGPQPVRSLRALLGQDAEAFTSYEPPTSYRRRFHFNEPVDNTEALLFPLRMMLSDLAAHLVARDAAIQLFTLRLVDSRRRVTLHPVGLSTPTRDVQRMLLVLKAQLERIEVEDGIVDLALEADHFHAFRPLQDDLFGSSKSAGQRYAELCDRLAARIGREAVRRIAVSPDQRPEAAQGVLGEGQAVAGTRHPPRPLWLLPRPQRITSPALLSSPERIELGWWHGDAPGRDYFVARDRDGRLCWVYREADQTDFFLHGLWQ